MHRCYHGIVLHAFEAKSSFSSETIAVSAKLRDAYGCHLDETGQPFASGSGEVAAMPVEFSHEVSIALPADEAFQLFTPKREELWVPGWRPDYVWPRSGEMERDMIFQTGVDDEATVWTCLEWKPEARHVPYLRTTPASRRFQRGELRAGRPRQDEG